MLASLVFSILSLLLLPFIAAQDVCNASRFASLACLTSDSVAATICGSVPMQTITTTTTTTTLAVETLKTSAHVTSQATVATTKWQKTTKTITTGETTTITSTYTDLQTESATLTTYVRPSTKKFARFAAASDSACQADLGSISGAALATACSCIGQPARTTTVTKIITAPGVQSITTDFAGLAPTTTLFKLSLTTIYETVAPTSTVKISTVTCTTSTKTVSMAAPSFTRAYGPAAGCENVAQGLTHALDASVNNAYDASQQCKKLCEQDSNCSSVYVQHLLPGYSGDMPYYQCYFSDKQLSSSNLKCGKKEDVWGKAIGYDACDRGTDEL